VYAREEFRYKSMLSAACRGKITGLGVLSYEMAVRALVELQEGV
jgi:3-dehydroquinate dehydratase-2